MQQINLYQPLFRKQEKIFSAKTMVQGALLVLTGVVLFYGYALWQTRALMAQLDSIQQRHDQVAQQTLELSRRYPERGKDQALAQQVETLRQQVQLRQQVVARLADRNEGNTAGYSDYLTGLARQRLPQLWLTHIGIRQGGRLLELDGSTLQADQVPLFLQRLTAEKAFAGAEFRYFTMNRPDKEPRQVDFSLHSDRVEKK